MDEESESRPFEPSSVNEAVLQSSVLDPSAYSHDVDRTVQEFDEADFQSHRNVYVAVHMPHSHSKHRSHNRHHKRKHGRHGNGRGHHSNGHNRDDDADGNGFVEHDVSVEQNSEEVAPSVASSGGEAQVKPRVPRISLDMTTHPVEREELLEGHPRFGKSHSLPSGHYAMMPDAAHFAKMEPTTPSDPCDRVKFILGGPDVPADHECNITHSVFTELEELKYDEHENRMEWKETARWIKFEEDVEEGGNKWSKPHVATLSLHSLFELRSCIFRGTVMLDVLADNLVTISDVVLDNLVSTGQLEEESREKVRAALLQKHRHLNSKKEGEKKILEHFRSLGDIARHSSKDFDMLNMGGSVGNGGSGLFSRSSSRRGSMMAEGSIRNGSLNGVRLEEEGGEGEHDPTQGRKPDSHFMKKLPPGSEASNVLVGEVDFLSHPIIAFVRLAQGQYLDITEVPIPTRFIFIMLGPTGNHDRYHEIGRSISTLMSDEVFHEVAYKARNRGDLMAGIDEFLDKVTVLPPGEWDPHIRLEPPSKVPSQANRKNTSDAAKLKEDLASEPYKCRHCKTTMDHPEPIKWTKKPFHGLLQDMSRCYNLYRSDFSAAISLQAVASLILIYFANITLAFTFGAILSDHTNSTLGATETILAVGIGNLFYSVFSCQPLVILGPTGPTLIFDQIVFTFCRMQDIPFLEFRFWIGLWTALFMFLLVCCNTSAITRLFTRFTEEIFTVLIGLIFMYQAIRALWDIHISYPYNEWITYPTKRRVCDCYEFSTKESFRERNLTNATELGSFWDDPSLNCSRSLRAFVGSGCPEDLVESHDVFLMSVILFFGTFLLSVYIKKVRNTNFFKSYIRTVFSDFAVFFSVVVWVVVDVLAQVDTPKLEVPNVFESGVYSQENRSFIINPLGNDLPSWAPGAAIIPAIMATILLFMDQHITAIIINRKDNKLKKHPGYHLDFTIISFLIFLHSLLGLPWVVGATILSISHVQSLYLYSSQTAPGERPKFIGVREQRVTLFFMAVFVLISVMLYMVLKLLPLPVLYGLVLYLGFSSLFGVQFLQRFKLFFVPNKHKPDFEYLRAIPNRRIYIYTGIQVVMLVLLCLFQTHLYLQILFPLLIVALVFGRWLLGFWFSKHDMELLDDPIPDALYCKPCRRDKHGKSKPFDLEGNHSVDDTLASSTQCSSQDIVSNSEPASHPGNAHADYSRQQRIDSFNISTEVDRCDVWRNMVKRLETSPEVTKPPEEETDVFGRPATTKGVASYEERGWNPLFNDPAHRTLSTLEECDNEAESPAQDTPSMPKFEIGSPGVTSPPQSGGVVLPPQHHKHWQANGPHEPWPSATAPVVFQSTSV